MKKRVMLIDDNADFLELMKVRLESSHYTVIPINHITDIVETVKLQCPDIIILDVVMPEADGYQVCSMLKNDPAINKIPVLLFSGKDLDSMAMETRCRELCAQGYVLKPVDSAILIKKIEELTTK